MILTVKKLKLDFEKITKVCLFITSTVLISGCGISLLTERNTNPVIQDSSGNWLKTFSGNNIINTFSTTASRRMVLMREIGGKDEVWVCAEPSPDVGEAIASVIADGIRASAQYQGVTAEISNQYARSISTQIAPLVYRTQGLQLYRDAMYGLCVDRMNGWIDKKEYEAARKANLEAAKALIIEEKSVMLEAQKAFYAATKADSPKISIDDVSKILEAFKSPIDTASDSTPKN